VVLTNFHAPPSRPLGNLGAKLPWDASNFLRRVNLVLGDRCPGYVHLNDVAALASHHGVANWFDPRYWYQAKMPVSFPCLVPFVRNTAQIIGALLGRTAKVLVLDLDNTLWGGVVGDDGPEGIVIGPGDPIGEAFLAFQEYALRLKQRGVLLAVCSKNDAANARAAFLTRTDMALKLDDFVAFKANWRAKPDNLREIARELNLGLDSLVFVDDNPVERGHVRHQLPEVNVVELNDDPADYVRLLDQAGLFEVANLSAEDAERTRQYQENELRRLCQAEAGDHAAYQRSLAQKATIRPFIPSDVDRITQLVNKSNQFNLTTLRLTRSQVEERMIDPSRIALTVRLMDRFGDNGLISVVCGDLQGDEVAIDLWLMSCRVLQRGVEQLVLNRLAERARRLGAVALRGTYIPTAKNGLVCDHYSGLGFAPAGNGPDGLTHWRLDLATFRPFDVSIEVHEETDL
jgi:FkbH-like protein